MSTDSPLFVPDDTLIIGDPADLTLGEQHATCSVDGQLYLTENVGYNVATHGLHYGTFVLSGLGAWRCADGRHRIFRPEDHMRRARCNAQFMNPKKPLPSEEQLADWAVRTLGVGIPQLVAAQDVYGRVGIANTAIAMGVGSIGQGAVVINTRDMIDYLPKEGVRLLFPGSLLRRAHPLSAPSPAKMAPNYTLSHVWKSQIAKRFGCNEGLMMAPVGGEIAETTGSIPVLIMPGKVLVVPRSLWRLNSITTATIMMIAEQMGYTVREEILTQEHLQEAIAIRLAGSWTGLGHVCDIATDVKWLNQEPTETDLMAMFGNSVGDNFVTWVLENFEPTSVSDHWAFSRVPEEQGEALAEAYWDVVRQRPGCQISYPDNWHRDVPALTYRVVPA